LDIETEIVAMRQDLNAVRRDVAKIVTLLEDMIHATVKQQFVQASEYTATAQIEEPTEHEEKEPVKQKTETYSDEVKGDSVEYPPTIQDLEAKGLNMTENLDYGTGLLIKTRKKLEGNLYNNYNRILKGMGYKWKADRENNTYGWEYVGVQKPTVTKIRDITPESKNITIEGTLLYNPNLDKPAGQNTVSEITVSDDTGKAKLSFWNETGDKITDLVKGDKVRVSGIWKYDGEYQGTPQLNTGKYVKVEKL